MPSFRQKLVPRRKLSMPNGLRLFAVTGFTLLLSATAAGQQRDSRSVSGPGIQAPQDLKEVLEIGLKARRPEEFRFIERIVKMVDGNQLPRDIVESTFHWARRQHKVPFPYFERGLRIRAGRIGIQI